MLLLSAWLALTLVSSLTAGEKLLRVDPLSGDLTLVSLDGSAENCMNLEAYPYEPVAFNYMESIGMVVACGGDNLEDSTRCYAFDGAKWTALADSGLEHCPFDTPNVFVEDKGWFITGHHKTGDGAYCSEEWISEIFDGESWSLGPAHPVGLQFQPCMVQLNTTHTLFAGGNSVTDTWLYNWQTEEWIQTGSLNKERWDHGCALIEGLGVLAVGGWDGFQYVETVELFDPATETWSVEENQPENLSSYLPVVLTWQNTVLAMFWQHEEVYQRAEDGTWSALEGVSLPATVEGGTGIITLVPDDFGAEFC